MTERYAVEERDGVVTLRDLERKAEVRIAPGQGNNVTHFRTTAVGSDEVVEVFLSPQDPGGLGANGYSAGNPILFPFPNRVKGGSYTFEGRTHRLDVNETARGNHIHGLVSNRAWTSNGTGASETDGAWHRASFRLDSDAEIVRQYP